MSGTSPAHIAAIPKRINSKPVAMSMPKVMIYSLNVIIVD
jgi:hypothetical protein